ncbi:hypothetical protein E1301_Tti020080 [Triplophysa tibetana]|uniref:HECT domain-containing protein n=1 Tax=Triplophysa tibetana TaxID=1572043 RepID=A0A5A9PRC1_9TELE|nr:hypothetical protein E1301_Tti020080 [Triplophysa tibetana]
MSMRRRLEAINTRFNALLQNRLTHNNTDEHNNFSQDGTIESGTAAHTVGLRVVAAVVCIQPYASPGREVGFAGHSPVECTIGCKYTREEPKNSVRSGFGDEAGAVPYRPIRAVAVKVRARCCSPWGLPVSVPSREKVADGVEVSPSISASGVPPVGAQEPEPMSKGSWVAGKQTSRTTVKKIIVPLSMNERAFHQKIRETFPTMGEGEMEICRVDRRRRILPVQLSSVCPASIKACPEFGRSAEYVRLKDLFAFAGSDNMASEVFSVQLAWSSNTILSTVDGSLSDYEISSPSNLYVLWMSGVQIEGLTASSGASSDSQSNAPHNLGTIQVSVQSTEQNIASSASSAPVLPVEIGHSSTFHQVQLETSCSPSTPPSEVFSLDSEDDDILDMLNPPVYTANENNVFLCKTQEEMNGIRLNLGEWIADCGVPGIYSATLDDMRRIYRQVIKHYTYFRTADMINQFKDGMNCCGNFWKIAELNWKVFLPVFTNQQKSLTREDFRALYTVCWKKQSRVTFEEVLVFITGADSIPRLGFRGQPRIDFHTPENRRLPFASTCGMVLFLPRGIQEEEDLTDMLNTALKGYCGFGKI